jgi:hypothetical protein
MMKFVVAVVVIALLALLLAGCVERMFFYPDSTPYSRPEQFGLQHEDVFITAVDGSRLHGWWLPAKGTSLGSVLHLHGNAANVSNHLPLVAWLPAAGFDVLMLDYRGFGRSQGRPTLDGVVDDAAAALAYLRTRPGVDGRRLVVLGQSLGGATALRLLARDSDGVRLAVIEAAFASYRGIARDAAAALKGMRVPLLIVHGTADEVIPFRHGEQLAAAAPAGTQFVRVDGARHMESLSRTDVQRRVLETMVAALR